MFDEIVVAAVFKIFQRIVCRTALHFCTLFAPPFKRITATSVSAWEMFQLR
jgi:hypothetical protein